MTHVLLSWHDPNWGRILKSSGVIAQRSNFKCETELQNADTHFHITKKNATPVEEFKYLRVLLMSAGSSEQVQRQQWTVMWWLWEWRWGISWSFMVYEPVYITVLTGHENISSFTLRGLWYFTQIRSVFNVNTPVLHTPPQVNFHSLSNCFWFSFCSSFAWTSCP